MTPEECKEEIRAHIDEVRRLLARFVSELEARASGHDTSKLEDPELEHFTRLTPKLKSTTYLSAEYKRFLEELEPALDHHYRHNRHHPEYFHNGVTDMTLVDLVEMFCDWTASCQRHDDGNLYESIMKNQLRFRMSAQLTQIFLNTAAELAGKSFLDYARASVKA